MAKQNPAKQVTDRKKKPLPKAAEPYKFKKGQSGNPLGGKLHNPEMRAVKKLTQEELAEVANQIISCNAQQLRELLKDPNTTVLKRILIQLALNLSESGDIYKLDVLLNRMIGKVKDQLDLNGNLNSGPKVIITLPSNGREVKIGSDVQDSE